MFELIGLVATGTATVLGYLQSRRFVRQRLAYVDVVHRSSAPWIAGALATVAAAPVVWVLPLVGGGTALLFGAGVGAGVAVGARETRHRVRPG